MCFHFCFYCFCQFSSRIEIFVITAGVKRYKSIIKKKKKKHYKIVLLAKTKLNSIEVLISKVLIDSNITHVEFASIIFQEYNDIKKEIKNLKTEIVNQRFHKTMLCYCLKCKKNTESKKPKVENLKNRRIMLSSNCAVGGRKKLRFIKKQDASGILINLGIRAPLSQVSLLGPILF